MTEKNNGQSVSHKQPEETFHKDVDKSGRRRVLIRAAKGTVAASTLFAVGKWSRPVVESVILPVHAQTSSARILAGSGSVVTIVKAEKAKDWLDILVPEAYAARAAPYTSVAVCLTETAAGSNQFNTIAEFTGAGGADVFRANAVPSDGAPHGMTQTLSCLTGFTTTIQLSGLTTTQVTVDFVTNSNTLGATIVTTLGLCNLPTVTGCSGAA